MARCSKSLTDTEIKKINQDCVLNDGQGLQLRVRRKVDGTFSKIWIFNYYKPLTKKRTQKTIGNYPTISLSQARQIKDEYRGLLTQNIDPQEYEQEQQELRLLQNQNTFAKVAEDWFEWRKSKKDFGERTAKQAHQQITKHLLPIFKDVPIEKIKSTHVIKALQPLKQEGKLDTIKRVIQRMNSIMNYAVNMGLLEQNNLLKVGEMFDTPKPTHQPCIHYDELPQFFKHLFLSVLDRQTIYLILWQLFTLSRPNETAQAKFSDIDEKAGIWSYYVLKGNKDSKLGRIHKVPLTRQMRALLAEIKANHTKHSPYLFPLRGNPNKPCSSETANKALKRIANGLYKRKQTAHGLRSIGSTWLNEQRTKDGLRKYDSDLIELALSHVNKDPIRLAYNHAEYLPARRNMLQHWTDFLDECSNHTIPQSHLTVLHKTA